MLSKTLLLGLVCIASLPFAHAQSVHEAEKAAEREAVNAELEMRKVERIAEREAVNAELETREVERIAEREAVDAEMEMRKAESRLAEAARRVAELSTRRLQNLPVDIWSSQVSGGPALGISIGSTSDNQGPVEGVEVLAVSPGGAAGDAGLRAGDVITAVNDESLSADTQGLANQKLLDFMSAVEEGDVVDVEYLRAGKSAQVAVAPRRMSPQVFTFGGPHESFSFSTAPGAAPSSRNESLFVIHDQSWGDMEMVKLTDDLGRYFGTSEGMLIVRAPEDDAYQLKDGDVILDIDGREPTSVRHALRILGSYQRGERLKLRIMRDQRARTLEIDVPDNRTGSLSGVMAPDVDVRIAPQIERRVVIHREPDERI